jgi:hypothetical protein
MLIAEFSHKGEEIEIDDALWQHDYGQKIQIKGLDLPEVFEVHFAWKDIEKAKVVTGSTIDGVSTVDIPNVALEQRRAITAYVYLSNAVEGETVNTILMTVNKRKAPENFEIPEKIDLFHHTVEATAEYQRQAKESEERAAGLSADAEAWAHGREDHPDQAQDNAKYYAEQAAKSAAEVPGKTEQAKKDIEAARKRAVSAVTSQQETSVQAVATEGKKHTDATKKYAETVASSRQAVEETAQAVATQAQEVSQNTQTVANNTNNAAKSAESAQTSANNAAKSAEGVQGAVDQITKNTQDVASLKEDMGNIPIGVTDIVDNMVDSDKLKYKYTNGSWKHIDKTVTLDAGNYMFVLYNSVLSSYGYICIYKDKINGTQILRKTTDGKYNFTLTEQTTLIISMQVSGAESVTEGTYQTYYSIYNIDSVIIPKELTGVNAVENKVNAVENKVNPITDCIIKNLIDFDAITYNSSEKYTGCFINDSGAVTANKYSSSYCVTDYMNIDKKGLSINYSVGNVYVAFYDVNKKYISASSIMLNTDNIYVPYVDGAVYARFTLNQNNMKYKQYCIVEGDKSYTLAPDECVFTEELKSKLSGLTSLSAVPPERLVIQKGKQSVLYMENMIKNTNILPKSASQTIMTNIGNMAYVTPSSDVADKSITYHFRDCLGRTVDETKNYSVVSAPSKDTLNVLCVGDSFTDIGTYVGTIKDDIEEDGITVNQIGNMGVSGKRHEARSGGTWDFVTTRQGRAIIVDVTGVSNLPITGYPGTTYQDENGFKWSVRGVVIGSTGNGKLILGNFNVDSNYGGSSSGTMTDADTAADAIPTSGTLTKTSNASTGTTSSGDNTISYSDVEKVYYNPFWNPMSDELDFNYYINKWGYNSPDIVVFSIGYNDVGASKYHTVESLASIVAKAKISVDRMHADYPDAKIVLNVNPLGYGGDTSNEISESMRSNNQVTYYEALINEFGESTDYVGYVEVCPSFMFVDRIDAYGSKTVTIGRRISKTITTAGDVTHCNTVGMNQIGDAIVPYIYYLVNLCRTKNV